MAETFTTKLGDTAKAGKRTRIWLEGKRLIAAGFIPGALFERIWLDDKLVLMVCDRGEFNNLARGDRGTVSGKGEKPIIDIVGALVAETFTGSHVTVTYATETITITN